MNIFDKFFGAGKIYELENQNLNMSLKIEELDKLIDGLNLLLIEQNSKLLILSSLLKEDRNEINNLYLDIYELQRKYGGDKIFNSKKKVVKKINN